tara:strand:- start:69 stop:275 length:207 start_codon:yes stop_codon:yes gene_type:complete
MGKGTVSFRKYIITERILDDCIVALSKLDDSRSIAALEQLDYIKAGIRTYRLEAIMNLYGFKPTKEEW